jgi:uncharacterized protein
LRKENMHLHKSHSQVFSRIRRAHGHLAKVAEMIEKGEPCLMVAQQLQAVISALSNAKTLYVQDHIEHCLADALASRKGAPDISEFKEIAKYL